MAAFLVAALCVPSTFGGEALAFAAAYGIVRVAHILLFVLAACLWWAYFDVTAIVAGRRLARAEEGREQNEIARDSYSYLHFPMVAGIALLAVGLKRTLAHVDDPLKLVPAVALLGGIAAYLLAHVAFRLRNVGSVSVRRLLCALVLLALVLVADDVSALVLLAIATALLVAMIVYEVLRYAEFRGRVRHMSIEQEGAD
jgi:low temperature requirement protein LtrA